MKKQSKSKEKHTEETFIAQNRIRETSSRTVTVNPDHEKHNPDGRSFVLLIFFLFSFHNQEKEA